MRPKTPKHRKTPRRVVSDSHLRMIRQLPCILSGRPAEAAHISYGDLDNDKAHNGMALKAHDCWVVPLAPELHRLATSSQHHSGVNERDWWQQFGIDPLEIAQRLWRCGRNLEALEGVVASVHIGPEARARVLEILEETK